MINLLRSPTGRAFVAIRDSEVSASCMGINLAYYKTMSFAISAALTGVGGALYAHKVGFISPEQFTLIQSIELVTIVIIGGVGSLHGAVLGAAFIIMLPQGISIAKGWLPETIPQAGLQSVVFGLILVGFIIFEPLRALRPLAEDPHLFRRVSVLPARHVPPPALLPALGAAAMSFFAVENLGVRFGGVVAVDGVSF